MLAARCSGSSCHHVVPVTIHTLPHNSDLTHVQLTWTDSIPTAFSSFGTFSLFSFFAYLSLWDSAVYNSRAFGASSWRSFSEEGSPVRLRLISKPQNTPNKHANLPQPHGPQLNVSPQTVPDRYPALYLLDQDSLHLALERMERRSRQLRSRKTMVRDTLFFRVFVAQLYNASDEHSHWTPTETTGT